MLGLFRSNPTKKLEKQYSRLLEEARDLQRNGDIVGFSRLSAEAEGVLKQLTALESPQDHSQT